MSAAVSPGRSPAAPSRLDRLAAAGIRPGDRLATDEVEQWCRSYAETRDPGLRERIILACLGLADRLAARYRHQPIALEDLRQAARVGLILAVDRYDPARGPAFVPYAVACVTGELKRHLRDLTWAVRVARPLKERTLAVCRAMDELSARLGREPTIPEVAAELALSPAEVAEALGAARSRSQLSLDQPLASDEETTTLGERLAAPGPAEEPEDLLALAQLLKELPETERLVIALTYGQDCTQQQIATQIGCSQMQVSRILRRALARLRGQLLGSDGDSSGLTPPRAEPPPHRPSQSLPTAKASPAPANKAARRCRRPDGSRRPRRPGAPLDGWAPWPRWCLGSRPLSARLRRAEPGPPSVRPVGPRRRRPRLRGPPPILGHAGPGRSPRKVLGGQQFPSSDVGDQLRGDGLAVAEHADGASPLQDYGATSS